MTITTGKQENLFVKAILFDIHTIFVMPFHIALNPKQGQNKTTD
jgi:hypothetical protein